MKSSVCVWLGIWLYAVHLLPPSMVLAAEEEAAKALVERADRIRFPQGGVPSSCQNHHFFNRSGA